MSIHFICFELQQPLVSGSQIAIFSFYFRMGKNRVWNTEQEPLVPSPPDFPRVLIGDDDHQ